MSALEAFDGERDGVAAAKAKRGDAALQVAALQFVKQRDEDARAGSADGMAERDCAAIDVYFFGIEFQARASRRSLRRQTLRSVRTRSTSLSRSQPVFARSFSTASTGAIITHFGSTPLTACATMRAMGSCRGARRFFRS